MLNRTAPVGLSLQVAPYSFDPVDIKYNMKIVMCGAFKCCKTMFLNIAQLYQGIIELYCFCDFSQPHNASNTMYSIYFYSVDLEFPRVLWRALQQIITICNFERNSPVLIWGHHSPDTHTTQSCPIHYILQSSTTVIIIYSTNHWALWIYSPDQKPTMNIELPCSVVSLTVN